MCGCVWSGTVLDRWTFAFRNQWINVHDNILISLAKSTHSLEFTCRNGQLNSNWWMIQSGLSYSRHIIQMKMIPFIDQIDGFHVAFLNLFFFTIQFFQSILRNDGHAKWNAIICYAGILMCLNWRRVSTMAGFLYISLYSLIELKLKPAHRLLFKL